MILHLASCMRLKNIGEEQTYELVANDSFLKNAIFHESGDVDLSPLDAIQYFAMHKHNKSNLVNELLDLLYSNKYRKQKKFMV